MCPFLSRLMQLSPFMGIVGEAVNENRNKEGIHPFASLNSIPYAKYATQSIERDWSNEPKNTSLPFSFQQTSLSSWQIKLITFRLFCPSYNSFPSFIFTVFSLSFLYSPPHLFVCFFAVLALRPLDLQVFEVHEMTGHLVASPYSSSVSLCFSSLPS